MAYKAVALITSVLQDTDATWKARVTFAPLVDYSDDTLTLDIPGIGGDVIANVLESAIKEAVKTRMQAYGVTFGLLDTVRVIGGLV